MLIHVLPKLYVPLAGAIDLPVRLVDLTVEEMGLVLRGDRDLTIRRPYPNKCYWVGCRKVGQKAIAGLFIESEHFLSNYTVVTRWAVNADMVLTHRVEHVVIDSEFDTVSDLMTLWYGSGGSLGDFGARWPECYAGKPPVSVQPRMDVLAPSRGGSKREVELRDVYSDSGVVVRREEWFMVPTIERERLLGRHAEIERLPAMEHAFRAPCATAAGHGGAV